MINLTVDSAPLAAGGGSSLSKAFTAPAGCTHLLVVPFWTDNPLDTVQSVTWNGATEALAVVPGASAPNSFAASEIWKRDNPTPGSFNVVCTWTGACRGGMVIIAVTGAQIKVVAVNAVTQAYTINVTGTTAPGGLCIAACSINDGTQTLTEDGAQTEIADVVGSPGGSPSSRCHVCTKVGSGAVSFTWTPTGSPGRRQIVAISLREVGADVVTQPAAPTDAAGQTAGSVVSGVPGTKAVSATINGVAIQQQVGLTVAEP